MKALMHVGQHPERHESTFSFLALFPLVASIVLAVMLVLLLAGAAK